jgi:hypothetical protein
MGKLLPEKEKGFLPILNFGIEAYLSGIRYFRRFENAG